MQQEVQSCTRRDSCCTVAETLWEVNNAFWIRQGRFRGCKLCVGVGRAKQQCNATQTLPAKQVSFNGKCKSTGQKTLRKCAGTSFSLCFYFFSWTYFAKVGVPDVQITAVRTKPIFVTHTQMFVWLHVWICFL